MGVKALSCLITIQCNVLLGLKWVDKNCKLLKFQVVFLVIDEELLKV